MICPFLTSQDEEVECFKECAFFNEGIKGEECPFAKVDFKQINMEYEQNDDDHINEKEYYINSYIDYFKCKS